MFYANNIKIKTKLRQRETSVSTHPNASKLQISLQNQHHLQASRGWTNFSLPSNWFRFKRINIEKLGLELRHTMYKEKIYLVSKIFLYVYITIYNTKHKPALPVCYSWIQPSHTRREYEEAFQHQKT